MPLTKLLNKNQQPTIRKHEIADFINRFKDIIPDWELCLDALRKPLPACCWANTLKISSEKLAELLQQQGFNIKKLAWHNSAFQLKPATSNSDPALGRNWIYLSGLLQIQEQVSMLSGKLLDAQPGETILDMCAAPGNKTAQIALAMKNTGTLIANDRNYQRLRALGQIAKRLGISNMCTTTYDGALFPGKENTYDRIMVDAPCSCLGTSRKKQQLMQYNIQQSHHLAGVQRALLRRAIFLAKPGARIIYSTCTYAPEENEAVVDWALRNFPNELEIIPTKIDNFISSPGILSWQGQDFIEDIKHAIRIWPHQNNSGGFFIAVLRKKQAKQAVNVNQEFAIDNFKNNKTVKNKQNYTGFEMLPENLRQNIIDRFGFAEDIFNRYSYLATNRGWYMLPNDFSVPAGVKHDSPGLFLIKSRTRFPKLTTTAAMLLGTNATKNYIKLTLTQVQNYISGMEISLSAEQLQKTESGGYVLVRYQQLALGVGRLCLPQPESNSNARLLSLFPISWQGGK